MAGIGPLEYGGLSGNIRYLIHHGSPLPLYWGGWETDTHRLEREGWKILADEYKDVYSDTTVVQVGAQSPDTKCLISGKIILHHREIVNSNSPILADIFRQHLRMQQYTFKDTIRTMAEIDFKSLNNLKAIDINEPVEFIPSQYRGGVINCCCEVLLLLLF